MTKAEGDVNSEVQVLPKDSHDLSVTLVATEKSETPEPEAGMSRNRLVRLPPKSLPTGHCSSSQDAHQLGCRQRSDRCVQPFRLSLGTDMMMGGSGKTSVARRSIGRRRQCDEQDDNDVNAEMQGPLTGGQLGCRWC